MNLFDLLRHLEITPSKRFSQNFLIDPNIPKKIVQKAGVEEGDTVLEIGPGLGALTKALLDAKAKVIAIEKDKRFIPYLREHFPTLILHAGDFLTFDLDTIREKEKIKVVANLPYNITSPILIKLAQRQDLFSSITVMVQEEVAERITANPGSKTIGSLTYFLKFYGDSKILFKVSSHSFYPAPKVGSVVMQLSLRPPPPCPSSDALFTLIRKAYEQRRKMLRTSLKSLYSSASIEEVLTRLSLPVTSRPEDLSLQDFINILINLIK